jgi:hypothetical protein
MPNLALDSSSRDSAEPVQLQLTARLSPRQAPLTSADARVVQPREFYARGDARSPKPDRLQERHSRRKPFEGRLQPLPPSPIEPAHWLTHVTALRIPLRLSPTYGGAALLRVTQLAARDASVETASVPHPATH